MIRIEDAFENGKALITFITAGDPDLDTTKSIIKQLEENGCNLIEIGIPFSDPIAEGEVIMGADERALKGGATTDKIFDMVKEIRSDINIPMVFMTYLNVVFGYGKEKFMEKCNECNIQGIIIPDMPYEEKGELLQVASKNNVKIISMIAPTSDERIQMISKDAEGFLYVVSSLGVTGKRKNITTDIESIIMKIKNETNVPCAVGFGIGDSESAIKMARYADGVIMGSAIVEIAAKYGKDSPKKIGEFVKEIRNALDESYAKKQTA